jgi:hypothetical protein
MSILKQAFPKTYLQLKKAAGRLYLNEVEQLTLERCQARVIDGPFKGMRYIRESNCSALAPKLLGTYEKELHGFIAEIIAKQYLHVIDIGSAEGYYAAGLALRMPSCKVHAFDIDPAARANSASLSALNGLDHVISIHGECSFETLDTFHGHSCVVICDIEGAELHLLDPSAAPSLKGFDVLVEIHDGAHSTVIHNALVARFSSSHDLTFAKYAGRNASDATHAPWLGHVRNKAIAVDEQRTFGIEWGFFKVKTNP